MRGAGEGSGGRSWEGSNRGSVRGSWSGGGWRGAREGDGEEAGRGMAATRLSAVAAQESVPAAAVSAAGWRDPSKGRWRQRPQAPRQHVGVQRRRRWLVSSDLPRAVTQAGEHSFFYQMTARVCEGVTSPLIEPKMGREGKGPI